MVFILNRRKQSKRKRGVVILINCVEIISQLVKKIKSTSLSNKFMY